DPADQRVAEQARGVVEGVARPDLLVARARVVGAGEVQLVQELEGDFAGLPALARGATARRLIGAGHVPNARGFAPPDDRRAGGSTRPSATRPRRPPRPGCPRRRPRAPTPPPRSRP